MTKLPTGFGNNGGFGGTAGQPVNPAQAAGMQGPGAPTATLAKKSKKISPKVLVKALSSSGEVTGQQARFAYGMPFL